MRKSKVVPCGKCVACRRRRQAAWTFRLLKESEISMTACFVTLTYSDDNLTYGELWPTLVKRDFQLFMKRLRKKNATLTNDKIVYYACGEYGENTFRPHYHMIAFNIHPTLMFDSPMSEIWQLGNARIDPCNIKTIQYVSKYVMKSAKRPEGVEPEFSLMSKGIGKSYLTNMVKRYYKDNQMPFVVLEDGKKQTMPRYFKERIFDEDELRKFGRDSLALIKYDELDATKRFEIYKENLYKNLKRKYDGKI